jgi:2-iminobutanoate/2-iminopropanoate deaminase
MAVLDVQALRANGMVHVSGQVGIVPGSSPARLVEGGVVEQAAQVLQNVKAILEAAGTSLAKVVRVTVLLRDM